MMKNRKHAITAGVLGVLMVLGMSSAGDAQAAPTLTHQTYTATESLAGTRNPWSLHTDLETGPSTNLPSGQAVSVTATYTAGAGVLEPNSHLRLDITDDNALITRAEGVASSTGAITITATFTLPSDADGFCVEGHRPDAAAFTETPALFFYGYQVRKAG